MEEKGSEGRTEKRGENEKRSCSSKNSEYDLLQP